MISDYEYKKLQVALDALIDVVRNNEEHPLADSLQAVGEYLECTAPWRPEDDK